MKKLLLIILLLLFQIPTSFACMPHSPSNLVTWIYEGVEYKKHPDWSTQQFIKLKDITKPLAWNYTKIWKYYYLHSDDNQAIFMMNNYFPWDNIIAIADYNNWDYEDYFAVYEIGKIVSVNGKLDIRDNQWTIKNWWKKLWWCWNYRPNNVMDERELLDKIGKNIEIQKSSVWTWFWFMNYVSWAFLIDKFIQWKWETYIWIWIILQLLIFSLYVLFFYTFIKNIKKKK